MVRGDAAREATAGNPQRCGLLLAGLVICSGCDALPKADGSRTASEKWSPPKEYGGGTEAQGDVAGGVAGAKSVVNEASAEPADEAEAGAVGAEGGVEDGAAEAEDEAPTLPPGDPGPAYFAIADKGVFMLDGGSITPIEKAPSKLLLQLDMGPDGKPWLLGDEDVMRIEGDTATVVAKTSFKQTGSVEAFAVDGDGHVWTVGFKGVAHWDGKAWTLEDKSALGSEVTLLKGIAVDKANKVWVVSSHRLHVKDGDTWKEVDLGTIGKERQPYFAALVLHPKTGAVHAVASTFVVEAVALDAVRELPVHGEGTSSYGVLAFAANGVGALVTDPEHVARFVDGAITRYDLGEDFVGTRVHHVEVDGQGRVWVTTDAGIAVLGPAAERVEWKTGSIPELAGKIEGLLVVGAGPQLPEVGEVQKGTLQGKILIDNAPLAESDIEMCPEPATFIEKSPCEASPVKFSGKTGPDGSFRFADAPLGAYGIAVRIGAKWKTTLAGQYGAEMKPGETHDVGTLKFKK
jgi:hypothetical protein